MGSYARHQERLRVARERMAIRKKVDLGKEVLTGKLRQKRLYNFTDEPAVEPEVVASAEEAEAPDADKPSEGV